MKLSKMLMEWAAENELHEPGDGPCHCDVCQRFVPAAISQEKLHRKMARALIDIHNGLPRGGSEESLRLKIADIEENGHPDFESEDTLDILMELYSDTLVTIWYILNKFKYGELEAVTENPPNNQNAAEADSGVLAGAGQSKIKTTNTPG